jgi:hypothetical protein
MADVFRNLQLVHENIDRLAETKRVSEHSEAQARDKRARRQLLRSVADWFSAQ